MNICCLFVGKKGKFIFEDVVIYEEEYENYIDGQNRETFEEYYEQKCEVHARYWDQRITSEYVQYLYKISTE